MEKKFLKYKKLRNEIDSLSKQLENQHQKHMQCKAGCDLCCMDYSIFPVEFYSILNDLKKYRTPPETASATKDDECIFLKDHKCTIYAERPIICRTHGLPLLYMSEDGNWELSACELNFTEFDMDNFNSENTFPQDKFNSELFMLNREFISTFSEKEFGEFDLIPVKELKKHISSNSKRSFIGCITPFMDDFFKEKEQNDE